MNDKEITKLLTGLLGKNAYNNAFEVEKDFRNIALCVDYLTMQLLITKRWCDEDGKQHIDTVIENVKGMLVGKYKTKKQRYDTGK